MIEKLFFTFIVIAAICFGGISIFCIDDKKHWYGYLFSIFFILSFIGIAILSFIIIWL